LAAVATSVAPGSPVDFSPVAHLETTLFSGVMFVDIAQCRAPRDFKSLPDVRF